MTYDEFINNIIKTRGRFSCGEKYHERHHIVPRCMGGTDDDENLIDLFPREHYIAHELLAKEHPDNQKLTYAWWMMSHCAANTNKGRYELTPDEYEEARIAFSKMRSKNSIGENNSFFGKHHSEKTRQQMKKNHADVTGSKNPMYNNGHRIAGSKNGMYGVRRYGKDSPNYGHKWTPELKEKLSKKLKGKGSIPIYCVELDEKFNSIREAAKKYNILESNISGCLHDRQKTAGKHPVTNERLHWKVIENLEK